MCKLSGPSPWPTGASESDKDGLTWTHTGMQFASQERSATQPSIPSGDIEATARPPNFAQVPADFETHEVAPSQFNTVLPLSEAQLVMLSSTDATHNKQRKHYAVQKLTLSAAEIIVVSNTAEAHDEPRKIYGPGTQKICRAVTPIV